MTLGATSVPAGSLLVFNGYPNPDRVIAVNPATGAVIASLALDANHDLTSGVYDPTSGAPVRQPQQPRQPAARARPGHRRAARHHHRCRSTCRAGRASPSTRSPANLWLGCDQRHAARRDHPRRRRTAPHRPRRCRASTRTRSPAWPSPPTARCGSPPHRARSTASIPRWTARPCPAPRSTQVIAVAGNGVAANGAQAAANVGQVIELVGTNFGAGTRVLFDTRDNAGNARVVSITPLVINAAGTRLQVLVPDLATTGDVRVVNHGSGNLGFGSYADAVYRNVTRELHAAAPAAPPSASPTAACKASTTRAGASTTSSCARARNAVFCRQLRGRPANAALERPQRRQRRARQLQPLLRALQQQRQPGAEPHRAERRADLHAQLRPAGLRQLGRQQHQQRPRPDRRQRRRREPAARDAEPTSRRHSAQTLRASAGIRLQIVPTLSGIDSGRPGEDDDFYLRGSGFMEGAAPSPSAAWRWSTPAQRHGRLRRHRRAQRHAHVVAPRTLDGPIRITTEGGYAQIAGPSFGAQPVTCSPASWPAPLAARRPTPAWPRPTPARPSCCRARASPAARWCSSRAWTTPARWARSPAPAAPVQRRHHAERGGAGARPHRRRHGAGQRRELRRCRSCPRCSALGGSVAAGNTLVLEGSGLTASTWPCADRRRGVGSFTVRTVIDGSGTSRRPAAAHADACRPASGRA